MNAAIAKTSVDQNRSELVCTRCKRVLDRIRRTPRMRLLMGRKRFRCDSCSTEYLYFLGRTFRL